MDIELKMFLFSFLFFGCFGWAVFFVIFLQIRVDRFFGKSNAFY